MPTNDPRILRELDLYMERLDQRLRFLKRIDSRLPAVYLRLKYSDYRNHMVLVAVLTLEGALWIALAARVSSRTGIALDNAAYYALSTIAQTTAALAGFLLAFVALRLPMIRSSLESGRHLRDALPKDTPPLGALLVNAFYVKNYESENRLIIRGTVLALAASGITVVACFLGLAAIPSLTTPGKTRLLLGVVALSLFALDTQLLLIARSLRSMASEAKAATSKAKAEEKVTGQSDPAPPA